MSSSELNTGLTNTQAIVPSVAISSAMVACASIISLLGGPSPLRLLPEYLLGAAICTVSSILIFVFVRVAALARTKPERPLAIVYSELRPKLPLLILPILLTPTFLAAFTAAKSAIPHLVGFKYDRIFANLDFDLFGTDPWRLTHMLIGPIGTQIIEFFYVGVWVSALAYSQALIPIFCSREFAAQFFTSRLLTWFVAGFVFAYAVPAAGPIFVDLADPTLVPRFAPLKAHLATMLSPSSPFINGPIYLEHGIRSGTAYSGGGISAMPSIHIAASTTYILAARGTKWFVPACLFATVILIGSIHSGYHYFVDSLVASSIAVISWKCVELFYAYLATRPAGAVNCSGLDGVILQ